jgi:hypothetical protein
VASPVVFADNSSIIFSWDDNRRSQGWDIYAKIVNWNWNGATDVEIIDNNSPEEFLLSQNYPNPFNPSTKIKFTIPSSVILSEAKNLVTLKVYDVLGNEVVTLVDQEKPTGEYEIEFSAIGGSLPAGRHGASGGNTYTITSGIYFYQLKAGSFIQTKKMILIK